MESTVNTVSFRRASLPAMGALVSVFVLAATAGSGSLGPARASETEATVSSRASTQESNWTLPRTPDGQPDLQGIWSNNTATPLQRPAAFEGKDALTDEELAEFRVRAAELRDSEQAGNLLGDLLIQQVLDDPNFREFDAGTGNYNSFWLVERELDARTSLIIDPPNGRIPPMTAGALARFGDVSPSNDGPAGPENLPLNERCITFGVPNLLAGYNSYFQIFQTPGHVVILQELIHDARIIPIDGRAHLDSTVRQLHGDSRGRWDGNTLEIETTNYLPQSSLRGATENVRIVERITLVDPETLEYVVTYDDHNTWTQPWTLMIPMKKSDDAMFEYACHEGNYAMEGILAGARVKSVSP